MLAALGEVDGVPLVLYHLAEVSDSGGAGRMFADLAESASDGILVGVGLDGLVTFASVGACGFLGRSEQQLIGQPFPVDLLDGDELQERGGLLGVGTGVAALLTDPSEFDRRRTDVAVSDRYDRRRVDERPPGDGASLEWKVRRDDGGVAILSASSSPLLALDGSVFGHLVSGQDVTAIRHTHDLLVDALETERAGVARLEELDKAKDHFVATVSHELRTPLTSILGYLELLQTEAAGPVPAGQHALMDAIERNAQRLSQLADDLLALIGLDADEIAGGDSTVDLRDVLSTLRSEVPDMLTGRRLSVDVDAPAAPMPMSGNARLLERALRNLLVNAIKFTDDGGSVSCTAQRLGDRLHLCVRDTGMGIDPQELSQVFTRFYRSHEAEERAIPGTGLGLSLVEGIARQHGGTVRVESQLDVGSCFTLDLPCNLHRGTRSMSDQ